MNNQLALRRNGHISDDARRIEEALARLGGGEVRETRRGRLMVALDLTGSREHSLDQARKATAAMFDAIKTLGAVAVKLVYYRGENECRASAWHNDANILSEAMRGLSCESGETQIARLLRLALAETETLCGVVFVGDHSEDRPGELRELAGALGAKSIPLFVFHECADDDRRSLKAKPVFKRMAEASGGVYCEFKPDSGAVLREMLSAVGAFGAGGVEGVKQVPQVTTAQARQLRSRLLLLGPGGGE